MMAKQQQQQKELKRERKREKRCTQVKLDDNIVWISVEEEFADAWNELRHVLANFDAKRLEIVVESFGSFVVCRNRIDLCLSFDIRSFDHSFDQKARRKKKEERRQTD